MDIWDWYNECLRRFKRDSDRERLRMARFHPQGFDCQETDPERTLALFTEGRNLAEQLGEPWWVLFYDVWRVQALIGYLHDYRNVLDLAVRCALEVRKPSYDRHPWKFAIFNHLVRIYTEIDPLGHADAIREALAYLEAELPPEPNDDRYVMLGRKRKFALARGDLDEALAVALSQIALGDADEDERRVGWYTVSVYCDLCLIYQRRGEWDAIAENAERAEVLARRLDQCESELAESQLWQAVLARRAGKEFESARQLRNAMRRMKRLRTPPSREYFDALVLYHDLGGELEKGLLARDEERKVIDGKGRLVSECEVRIKRCRLLAQLERLRPEDLEDARAAAQKLRLPDRYLAQIERIAADKGR